MKSKRAFTFIIAAVAAVALATAASALAYRAFAQTATDDDEPPVQGTAGLSAEEVNAKLAVEYPDAVIVETELEMERGRLIYSVELADGTEVAVDANTGRIISSTVETEHDAQESE